MEQSVRRTGLAVLVILSFVLAIGAGIQDFRFDHSLSSERAAANALDRDAASIDVALSDLRAAQATYLATGQGPAFWMQRTTDLSDRIDTTLARLGASTSSSEAHAKYEAASAALADLMSIDKRVRTSLSSDQKFSASDLVFVDGLDAAQRLSTELGAARTADAAAGDTRVRRLLQLRLAVNGAALGLLLAVIVWSASNRPAKQAAPSAAASMAQMLRELPPPVKATPAPAPAPIAAAPAVKPAPLPVSAINLPDAADLCGDLARVIDDRDVPALLERTAKILDAKGVIVWVADRAGLTLRPAVTHGYSDKVLLRLGVLDVAADNVTSLSFRSMRPQMMNGAGLGSPAAIAIPLLTVGGCAGVLAAEVRESRPPADMIAVAKIIAAQFATLIAPSDVEDSRVAVEG